MVTFKQTVTKVSVPSSLFCLMSMVVRGSNIKVITVNVSQSQASLTLSQHLQYKYTFHGIDK